MTPLPCPRCHSYDMHRSRLKTPREQAVYWAFGRKPKRCAACGWRGYRGPTPDGPTEVAKTPAPPTPAPPTPPDPYRKHRTRVKKSSPLRRTLQTAAFALILGLSVGGGLYSCGGNRAAPVASE